MDIRAEERAQGDQQLRCTVFGRSCVLFLPSVLLIFYTYLFVFLGCSSKDNPRKHFEDKLSTKTVYCLLSAKCENSQKHAHVLNFSK